MFSVLFKLNVTSRKLDLTYFHDCEGEYYLVKDESMLHKFDFRAEIFAFT